MKLKLTKLNDSRKVIKSANVLLVLIAFLTFGSLLMYQTTRSNLVSPLIPNSVFVEIYNPIAKTGLIYSSVLLGMILLKVFKQNFGVLVLGLLVIIINELLQLIL